MLMTGLAGIRDSRVLQRVLWQQSDEYMTVYVARLGTLGNPWHVATDTVAKRVN